MNGAVQQFVQKEGPDAGAMAAACGQDSATIESGKARLLTLDDLDRRTRSYQSADRLLGDLISDMGGDRAVSAAQRELARRAAVMGAMIEDGEARYLRGESINLGDHLSAVNAFRRVLATIGLERRARSLTPDPLEYARGKAAA